MAKVVVGLSGGVDSAVSAYLLQTLGHEVVAVFMKNWEEDDGTSLCQAAADFEDAKRVAEKLQIPLTQVNFADTYWELVFEPFLADYRAGLTPNPDILCNRHVKFGVLREYVREMGADALATGHYARVQDGGLYLAKDRHKDQTYFLYGVARDALFHLHLPLGDYEKPEVRALARKIGLPNADKKDSTGICFIGERPMRVFLSHYLPREAGEIVDETGRVLGVHEGLWFYTLGQRAGLNIGGVKGATEGSWYVVDKRSHTNQLVVSQSQESLMRKSAFLNRAHFLLEEAAWEALLLNKDEPLLARFRHGGALSPIHFDTFPKHDCPDTTFHITTETPVRSITLGQSVVFYKGGRCLGGAVVVAV